MLYAETCSNWCNEFHIQVWMDTDVHWTRQQDKRSLEALLYWYLFLPYSSFLFQSCFNLDGTCFQLNILFSKSHCYPSFCIWVHADTFSSVRRRNQRPFTTSTSPKFQLRSQPKCLFAIHHNTLYYNNCYPPSIMKRIMHIFFII